MELHYCKVRFALSFSRGIVFETDPIFLLRSVLGMSLRSMCCVFRGGQCAQCEHNQQCSYAYVFESIIDKNSEPLAGRDRASHPYIIRHALPFDYRTAGAADTFEFEMVLAGKAIEYLPYIYGALVLDGCLGEEEMDLLCAASLLCCC